jgi:hypothetical protein
MGNHSPHSHPYASRGGGHPDPFIGPMTLRPKATSSAAT